MSKFKVITEFPIAFDSPDHLYPWGTKNDNSSNANWVKNILKLFGGSPKIMDLGCAGGQLIKDFLDYTPYAIGLEGSDYSIIHNRACWPQLYNSNLFTCDISRPFSVEYGGKPFLCDIISAWELCEHIHPDRINIFLKNIYNHLGPNGVFMASVSNFSDYSGVDVDDVDGEKYELHQSWRLDQNNWNDIIESTGLFTIKEYDKSIGYVRPGHFLLHCARRH